MSALGERVAARAQRLRVIGRDRAERRQADRAEQLHRDVDDPRGEPRVLRRRVGHPHRQQRQERGARAEPDHAGTRRTGRGSSSRACPGSRAAAGRRRSRQGRPSAWAADRSGRPPWPIFPSTAPRSRSSAAGTQGQCRSRHSRARAPGTAPRGRRPRTSPSRAARGRGSIPSACAGAGSAAA